SRRFHGGQSRPLGLAGPRRLGLSDAGHVPHLHGDREYLHSAPDQRDRGSGGVEEKCRRGAGRHISRLGHCAWRRTVEDLRARCEEGDGGHFGDDVRNGGRRLGRDLCARSGGALSRRLRAHPGPRDHRLWALGGVEAQQASGDRDPGAARSRRGATLYDHRNLMRCPGCGTEVSPSRQSCPLCQALIHADELKRLAREAEEAEADRPADALNAWRRALELLPPESGQARTIAQRAEALSRRAEAGGAATPTGQAGGLRSAWKGGGVVAVLVFLLTKAKFLLLGLTKIGTLGTMLLSLGVYWSIFGWRLALGLILSIYVHEMGHVSA